MSSSFGSIEFSVLLDSDGAIPLPTYGGSGSTRQIVNSSRSKTQYTGTTAGLNQFDIYCTRDDYDDLVASFRTFPRVAETLTVTDIDTGSSYIETISAAKSYLDGSVRATIAFRKVT